MQETANPPAESKDLELKDATTALNVMEIQAILPHRYPFLLIDRVIEIERLKRIVAIMEAMAQAGGALLLTEIADREHKLMVFTGIERAKFRKPVTPGDQLRIEVTVTNWRTIAVKLDGKAFVGNKLVCEASISCALVNR
jgi:3-hydroxyacyl-[acyl-carrier-protein] dehydratase